ncbi:hypothetical protein Dvar_13350 [Desulfosarcina variabilis str. Montpellier]
MNRFLDPDQLPTAREKKGAGSPFPPIQNKGVPMDRKRRFIAERIDEVSKICDRENPIYEQVSNFSIALYVLGYLSGPDVLSVRDMDFVEAGTILKEEFEPIARQDFPPHYSIFKSTDNYLLVIGDPDFPTHFAVVTDMHSPQPYFSKLDLYGSGFDSLAELEREFQGTDGVGEKDFFYYRMRQPALPAKTTPTKIYTLDNSGNYSIWEYQSPTYEKEERLCR